MIRNPTLRKQLANVNIEQAFGVSFHGQDNTNTFCPFHENAATSATRSASVSSSGLFNCKSCGVSGDAFDFHARTNGMTRAQAINTLTASSSSSPSPVPEVTSSPPPSPRAKTRQGKKILEPWIVDACRDMLQDHTSLLTYLKEERGFTDETLEKYRIGCDERRITIPIYDAEDSLVNIRRYLPYAQSTPKMLSYGRGYGVARLYPLSTLQTTPLDETIVLCEGEWDAILLNQEGIPAITVTSGVTSWSSTFTTALADRRVAIIYDVNDKEDLGQRIAWERARLLRSVGCIVKIVKLPLPTNIQGGDVTDYLVREKHLVTELWKIIEETPEFDIPSPSDLSTTEGDSPFDTPFQGASPLGPQGDTSVYPVTLEMASKAEFFYKRISLTCIVAGKGVAPYLPPRHISVEIVAEDGSTTTIEKIFDPWDSSILSLIQCSEMRLKSFVRTLLGIPKNTIAKITVLDTFNIEEVYLIPSIDPREDQGPYVLRKCFFVGHGLQTNRIYKLEGFTLPDPRSQAATHILTRAEPAETDIDTFKLKEGDEEEFHRLFSPKEGEAVGDKIEEIGENLSQHITKIYGRADLHTAIDLCFHSVIGFFFDDSFVHKGWIEALILGDTRTGKGFVTERLCKHYKVGEVVSGENITLAGLVGGVQRVGDRWTLVWGKIPLADKRIIIMDEAGALSSSDISRLSRIRSEGVAEITKIISERTTARTRLIWLANPRPSGEGVKRLLADYNYGIESVPELIGAPEDVARFDFALVIAHNEVPASVINRRHLVTTELLYSSEACHRLVMWAWSRKSEQVIFSEETTSLIMKMAQELAKMFTAKIPLIQGEDVRFKIARIAAAAAARTFSTDDGERLLVEDRHVEFAYNFLFHIYSRPTSGYDQLSAVERERSTLRNPKEVQEILEEAGDLLPDLIDGLLEHRQIGRRDLCDYAGLDQWQAQTIISSLVRARAIIKEYSWYVKKPAFKDFLRKLKSKQRPDNHYTMPDQDEDEEQTDE